MTVSTATFISTIEQGSVVVFATPLGIIDTINLRGVVVAHGLLHRKVELGMPVAYDFAIDGPADVPCLIVRVENREYHVLASALVAVEGVQVCAEGRVFCGCCI